MVNTVNQQPKHQDVPHHVNDKRFLAPHVLVEFPKATIAHTVMLLQKDLVFARKEVKEAQEGLFDDYHLVAYLMAEIEYWKQNVVALGGKMSKLEKTKLQHIERRYKANALGSFKYPELPFPKHLSEELPS